MLKNNKIFESVIVITLLLMTPNAHASMLSNLNEHFHNLGNTLTKSIDHIISSNPTPTPNKPTIVHKVDTDPDTQANNNTQPPVKNQTTIAVMGDWVASSIGDALHEAYKDKSDVRIRNLSTNSCMGAPCSNAGFSNGGYANLEAQLQAAQNKSINVLIICIGANETQPLETAPTSPSIEQFVTRVKSIAPTVIWVSTPPIIIRDSDQYLDNYKPLAENENIYMQNNTYYSSVCSKNNISYLDITSPIMALYNDPSKDILVPDTPALGEDSRKAITMLLQQQIDTKSTTYEQTNSLTKSNDVVYNLDTVMDQRPNLIESTPQQGTKTDNKNVKVPPGRADNFSSF